MKCQQVTNYDVLFNMMDSIRLFRILIFHSLKLGIRDFKSKIATRFRIDSIRARGRWDAKNKPWDYGIRGFVGRDHGIEESYWGPSNFTFQ